MLQKKVQEMRRAHDILAWKKERRGVEIKLPDRFQKLAILGKRPDLKNPGI